MGLFTKDKEPVFLKTDSDLEKQVELLKAAMPQFSEPVQNCIQEDIAIYEYGIAGEKRIEYELRNSHIPMYVLHDLYFEHEGLTAQIDFFIVTEKCNFIIECKNLYGTIEVNDKGEFTRTVYGAKRYHKEGIYSPVTQNERHLALLRAMRLSSAFNRIMNTLSDDYFSKVFIPVVVIANDKSVLKDRYAKKEIRKQIIKSDRLVAFIKETNEKAKVDKVSDKLMHDAAERWLSRSVENKTDYLEKYRNMEAELKAEQDLNEAEEVKEESISVISEAAEEEKQIVCPRCGAPMIKRTAKKGDNAGNEFYGCSRYPKCRMIINIS